MPLAFVGTLLIAGAGEAIVSGDRPFGWLGSILLATLGAFTLHKAGSVKAWKETAEARAERLEDLEREVGELRSELGIPERIQGIIALMGEQSVRADAAAAKRMEEGLARLDERWRVFNEAAEARSARIAHELAVHDERVEGRLAALVASVERVAGMPDAG